MISLSNAIILFFSMIIQVILPPLPAEFIVIGAGKLYGVLFTTVVAGTGLWIGSLIVYYIGRNLHDKFDRFFNRQKVAAILKKVRAYKSVLLWIRILPYNPSDIISYTAGIAKIERKHFFGITLVTSYIRCFVLALLGSFIISLKSIFIVGGLLVFSAVGAHFFLQHNSPKAHYPRP
ncbi:VTT domain-containing protein [Candidatus Woesearchaeota archaeon]|nr:VTT domain-containing protein [Candidatus Woesearchaeota archaeon]